MFGRIVGAIAIGVVAVLALDHIFLRRRAQGRPSLFWQVAPVIGFVGAILLGLALVEAIRREVVDAWRWGTGLGLVLTLFAGIFWFTSANARGASKASGWSAWVRIAQTYGIVLLFGLLGVVLAVRVIGALLEVFLASALGVLAIGTAIGILAAGRRGRAENSKH